MARSWKGGIAMYRNVDHKLKKKNGDHMAYLVKIVKIGKIEKKSKFTIFVRKVTIQFRNSHKNGDHY